MHVVKTIYFCLCFFAGTIAYWALPGNSSLWSWLWNDQSTSTMLRATTLSCHVISDDFHFMSDQETTFWTFHGHRCLNIHAYVVIY